jgi:hypothetical protein
MGTGDEPECGPFSFYYLLDLESHMHKITLVCSAHRENGLCNAGELLKIIQAIEPEAVFEEIRPSDFDFYRKHGITSSLEAQAITRYLEFKSFHRVPVDRYEIPENHIAEIKRELDCVFDCVEQRSRENQLLNEENDKSVCKFGFSHLNSVACATVMSRIAEIEEQTINETGNQGLIHALAMWHRVSQKRETEMVCNIYEYCRENVFETGLFLVGAAYKTGIVKAIETYASAEADLLDWKFSL